ncbi:MAG: PKD domain-containing protein [Bacteroidales bacterium]|nr:PKD domain-containing protein [Bacteroidales bacterium]
MKRLFTITILSIIILVGCETYPYADFSVNYRIVTTYEVIQFYNRSDNAVSYRWNFDDGIVSTERNPVHSYTHKGIYEVSLTVYSSDGNRDIAYMTIEVYDEVLEITVAEWNPSYVINYIVPGASVRLYPSLGDWDNETNLVVEGFTDSYGVVLFTGLLPQRYYVDVWHEYYDNWLLREDDPGFVTTQPLNVDQYNTFIAWVDYYPPSAQKRERIRDNVQADKIKRQKRTFMEIDVSK